MKLHILIISILSFALLSIQANAQETPFHTGPVFHDFANTATVDVDISIPKDHKFKVSFDASKQGQNGKLNQTFNSAARFINMHVAAGVPIKNIDIAIVIHGTATLDLLKNKAYKAAHNGVKNVNIKMIKALMDNGVKFYLCGQSAAYRAVDKKDLIPGVKLVLSAMTAHALLQDEGYTLNPF
ncbi:MAG: DsrE family protein [Emcibacteraceae bacterium]|nr:DsrE family protein [Emcibacteraceae bacterium]